MYVHIPFCTRRCDYCDFTTWADRSHLMGDYVGAVVTEIERAGDEIPVATSVYFGGGTPSLLAPAEIGRVLGAIRRSAEAEVTVECNPETVDVAKLRDLRSLGVNRLSFGAQSMVPHVLASLGRAHEPDDVRRAVDAARTAGFGNLNLDLIYGAVGESIEDWQVTVEAALALEPNHVSAYGLTVERGASLASEIDRHPDDDDMAEKYSLADEQLRRAGLGWYEISNFAERGRECRHNLLYWMQGDYRGFGCAAHSHRRGRRWWNLGALEGYLDSIEQGCSPIVAGEELDPEERRVESLQLVIRTRIGVPARALVIGDGPGEVPPDLVEVAVGERCDSSGDVPASGSVPDAVPGNAGRLRLSLRGRLLANEVSSRIG